MEPQDRDLLIKTLEYARENNKILRGIRSTQRRNSFFKFVYWVIILLLSVWLYNLLEPYVLNLIAMYKSLPIENFIKN